MYYGWMLSQPSCLTPINRAIPVITIYLVLLWSRYFWYAVAGTVTYRSDCLFWSRPLMLLLVAALIRRIGRTLHFPCWIWSGCLQNEIIVLMGSDFPGSLVPFDNGCSPQIPNIPVLLTITKPMTPSLVWILFRVSSIWVAISF